MRPTHRIYGHAGAVLAAVLAWAAASLLTGCNEDAFVCGIRPDRNDISMDETGDTLTVNFQTDDWYIASIWNNGREIADDSSLQGMGRLIYSSRTLRFTITRDAKYSLRLAFAPNFSPSDNNVIIYFGNSVETDSMTVRQTKSSGYSMEKIVWDTSPVTDSRTEYVTGWSLATDNSGGTEPVISRVPTYNGIRRTVNFIDTCSLYLFESFKVRIPKGVLDGEDRPVMGDDEVEYTPYTQTTGFDGDKDETVITFPAGESRERFVLWLVNEVNFRYRLHLRSNSSGKEVTVAGMMNSRTPYDAWGYWK